MKKRIICLFLAALTIFLLTSCSGNKPESMAESEANSAGVIFMDASLDVVITILKPDWIYQTDESSQVFFYNEKNQNGVDLICLSAQSLVDDAATQIESLWAEKESQMSTMISGEIEEINIKVGQNHEGKSYEMILSIDGSKIYCKYLFWSVEDNLYICSATAFMDFSEEVKEVLDEITTSFSTYSEFGL